MHGSGGGAGFIEMGVPLAYRDDSVEEVDRSTYSVKRGESKYNHCILKYNKRAGKSEPWYKLIGEGAEWRVAMFNQ